MRNLDAFADAGKQHGVIADDIAAAHGGKTDGRRIAFAGHAFARIDGTLLEIPADGFRNHFAGSPIKRIGRDRFVRNVLVAIGNSRMPALLPAVEARLGDAAAVVRGAAVWAAGRLADREGLARLHATHGAAEREGEVTAEWRALGFGDGRGGCPPRSVSGSD